jgi:dihydropteroate synthase
MPDFRWGPLLAGSGPFFIGILNITPDSFSDGGRFLDPRAALAQAQDLVDAGAGMLDVGAESTRPGAEPLDPREEWRRLEPVLKGVKRALPHLPFSVDTRHAGIAAQALALGASVLNDVTGFSDPRMFELASTSGCGLIAMRSRIKDGLFWMPPYDDPAGQDVAEAVRELREIRDRLLGATVARDRILLDPGFGFGTTFQEDLALWEALPGLPQSLDWPVDRFCLGVSRKRFVARQFGGDPNLAPCARDRATAAAHQQAARWGYRVFRTHAPTAIAPLPSGKLAP